MSDPVLDAAQLLAPFLAAGGDAAVAEVTRQARKAAAAATRRVLEAVRGDLPQDAPADEEAVAAALRAELERGSIAESDLRYAVEVLGAGRDNHGAQVNEVKGNAYIGNTIEVKGDFKG